jgi:hypothetical protein
MLEVQEGLLRHLPPAACDGDVGGGGAFRQVDPVIRAESTEGDSHVLLIVQVADR